LIVVEDLKVSNMTKHSKAKQDDNGKYLPNKQAQKSGLNKAILDQGWSMFVGMLQYKQAELGGVVLKVPPHYTSQTCPCCHHVDKENRQTQSEFVCVECGYAENADVVGAKNVLRAGHAQLACVVSGAVMPPSTRTPRNRNPRSL
jgi:putative transposase